MKVLAYSACLAVLASGMLIAQNSKPASDPSNSTNASPQAQQNPSASDQSSAATRGARHKTRHQQNSVPDTTIQDQQTSTTSTTGVAGENNTPSSSRSMGTTGRAPGTVGQAPAGNSGAISPQTGTSTDQQPNTSTSPSTPPPQAASTSPGVRAAATHTPDPGTCMNPAAVDNGQTAGSASAAGTTAAPRLDPRCE